MPAPTKKKITRARIIELYHGRKLSMKKVGAKLGVSETVILRLMRKFEIARRTRGDAERANFEHHAEAIREMTEQMLGAQVIADKLGVSKTFVLNTRKRLGIEGLPPSRPPKDGPASDPWRLRCERCGADAWVRTKRPGGDHWLLVVERWARHALMVHGIPRERAEPMLWDGEGVSFERPGEYDRDLIPSQREHGSQGGKRAAESMTVEAKAQRASKGGRARSCALGPEARREIARHANQARRWKRVSEERKVQRTLGGVEASWTACFGASDVR